MPTSQSIWNALLTVLGVALMAVLGWQMSQIAELKERAAAEEVSKFTEEEANLLRRELTDVLTKIDMRLSLIERDIDWIKTMPGLRNVAADWEPPAAPTPDMGDEHEPGRIEPDMPIPDPPPAPKSQTPNMIGDGVAPESRQQIQQLPRGLRYDLRK